MDDNCVGVSQRACSFSKDFLVKLGVSCGKDHLISCIVIIAVKENPKSLFNAFSSLFSMLFCLVIH